MHQTKLSRQQKHILKIIQDSQGRIARRQLTQEFFKGQPRPLSDTMRNSLAKSVRRLTTRKMIARKNGYIVLL